MLASLRDKIERRIPSIENANYLGAHLEQHELSFGRVRHLRSAEAFILDFYKQELQNLATDPAIDQTELQRLQNEVDRYRATVNKPILSPESYVLIAIKEDDLELFNVALSVGVPANELNNFTGDESLLTHLADEGKVDFIECLLAVEGIDIHVDGIAPLLYLCARPEAKTLKAVNHLLSLGMGINGWIGEKHPNYRYKRGETAILKAARANNPKIVQRLLQVPNVDFHLDVADDNENTALHYGVFRQNDEIVTALLEAGAPVNWYIFRLACEKGGLAIVKSLAEATANQEEKLGYSYFIRDTAASGHQDVADYLLSKGAQIDYYEEYEKDPQTPLSEALENGHSKLANHLISLGANKELAQKFLGWTDMMITAILGDMLGLLTAYRRGDVFDLTAYRWCDRTNPTILVHAHNSQPDDIIYLLRIMPTIRMPEPKLKCGEKWEAGQQPQTPEGRKAYAILDLKQKLCAYQKERSALKDEHFYCAFGFFFGGYSRQEN